LKVKASEPLEAYKRHREQKGEQRRREDDRRRDRRSMSREDGHSDADADGESEVEWDDGKTKLMPSAHEELLADIKDFERVRVGRTNFAKVCFYPTFNDAISGCFCRVSIGIDRSNGQNMYRMTQIKGFAEGRPYAMEGHNGKSFITDQYAVVVHGSAEKEYPFIACSDSKFTEYGDYDDGPRRQRTQRTRLRERGDPEYVQETTYIERGHGAPPRDLVYRP
ncbi:hypothetical protein B0A49_13548, partial [Cryomyces minteri]